MRSNLCIEDWNVVAVLINTGRTGNFREIAHDDSEVAGHFRSSVSGARDVSFTGLCCSRTTLSTVVQLLAMDLLNAIDRIARKLLVAIDLRIVVVLQSTFFIGGHVGTIGGDTSTLRSNRASLPWTVGKTSFETVVG